MRSALLIAATLLAWSAAAAPVKVETQAFPVPKGSAPHDVAADPSPGGVVWIAQQRAGALGRLDPKTGKVDHIALGQGSAPHGVIVGPDGAPWLTDGGQNAIVRVDPKTDAVKLWKLPESVGYANLNTAAFDAKGRIWFTGQNGIYGRLDPASNDMDVWQAPKGRGPYGIAATPKGRIFYVSLAGSHLAEVDIESGAAKVIEPPTAGQGARRVWSDSKGRLYISEWNSGQLSRYEPEAGTWKVWKLPGERPRAYAVYVDERDAAWVSDWGANAMVRFDPETETFQTFPIREPNSNVRQILGRKGEVWTPESGLDRIVVYRFQ
jgi:virginiamycin B lyase